MRTDPPRLPVQVESPAGMWSVLMVVGLGFRHGHDP